MASVFGADGGVAGLGLCQLIVVASHHHCGDLAADARIFVSPHSTLRNLATSRICLMTEPSVGCDRSITGLVSESFVPYLLEIVGKGEDRPGAAGGRESPHADVSLRPPGSRASSRHQGGELLPLTSHCTNARLKAGNVDQGPFGPSRVERVDHNSHWSHRHVDYLVKSCLCPFFLIDSSPSLAASQPTTLLAASCRRATVLKPHDPPRALEVECMSSMTIDQSWLAWPLARVLLTPRDLCPARCPPIAGHGQRQRSPGR